MPADSTHRVGLHETDAAGVMFAGHIVTLAHSAYETALATAGCDLAELIRSAAIALPLVRCEADFRAPLHHGQELTLRVRLLAREERGYRVRISLAAQDRDLAVVEQLHACIDRERRRCALPPAVAAALDRLGSVQDD
jgi:1,4-dihydroxy-2-naphthoyl-CoA hydrolase